MPDKRSHGKTSIFYVLLYAAMATLLVFSVVLFKLRIFSDAAVIITDMLRTRWFATAHFRYIADLNQLAPLLLSKLHVPLRDVLLSYSINHELVPIACALLCMHWLRRPYHALAILLLCVLMAVKLFYYPVSELQTGLVMLLMYDALADEAAEGRRRKAFYVLGLFLLPTVVFAHPMAIISALGWLFYRLLKQVRCVRQTGFAAVIIVISILVKKFWFTSSYESGKMMGWDTIRPFGLNYYYGPFARSWYKYVVDDAFLAPVLALLTIAMLWRLRNFGLIALLLAMWIGIFTLVALNFENWSDHLYDQYYEHHLQPLIFFLVLMGCYALSRLRVPAVVLMPCVALVFAVSFVKIAQGSAFHTERQKWMAGYLRLMEQMHIRKAVLGRVWIREDMIRGSYWSGAQETLLLSAIRGPQHARTLFLSWDPDHIREPVQTGVDFVMDGRLFKVEELPRWYFHLDDKPYVILDHVVPDSTLRAMYWP